ncbi:MAG: stage III sporulation protein AF [Firmicutes bacterium HGW-Firmicutes-13]|nr:MAG: stage III sporulation protein AF [Firmicutes bacterium HGW-Firmicutes-13]
MLEMVKHLIKNLIILVILASFLEIILPDNKFQPYIKLVVGIMIMISILNPLLQIFNIIPDLEMEILKTGANYYENVDYIDQEVIKHNQQLVVKEYKRRLNNKISEIISKYRQLEAVVIRIEVEENMAAENFGNISEINMILTASDGTAAFRESTVFIDKIDIQVGGESLSKAEWEKDITGRFWREKEAITGELVKLFSLEESQINIKVVEEK